MHSGIDVVYNVSENVMDSGSYVIKPLSKGSSALSSPKQVQRIIKYDNYPKRTLLDELNALEERFEDDTPTSFDFYSNNNSPS